MGKNSLSFLQAIQLQYVVAEAILVFFLLLYLLRLLIDWWLGDPRLFSNQVHFFEGWSIGLMINAVLIFLRWYKISHLFKTGQVVLGKITKLKSKWHTVWIEYSFPYEGRVCQDVMELFPTKTIKALRLETHVDIVFEPGNPYQSAIYDLHVGG